MKRFTQLLILLQILLTSCSRPDEVDFMVLYTTQNYGNILPWDFRHDTVNEVSLANFMSLVREQRAIYGDRCLVLDNGNMHIRGLSNFYWRYLDTICEPLSYKAQRIIGYDAVSIGHSEMRLSEPFLAQRHDTTQCPPTICTNLFDTRTNDHVFRPWVCLERQGIRIAIFSLVDEDADSWTPRMVHPNIETRPMIECMRDEIMAMRHVCHPDLVIGMVSSPRPLEDIALQEQIPGIDLVLGIDLEDKAPRSHAGMVRIHLSRNDKTKSYDKHCIHATLDLGQYEIDPQYAEAFADDITLLRTEYRKDMGNLPDQIVTSYGIYSSHDYYRDIFHQAHFWYAPDADISFANIANPDATIEPGPVTISRICDIFNHENILVEFWMKGEEVKRFLEVRYASQYNTLHSPSDPLLALRHDDKGHQRYNPQGQPYLNVPPSEFTSAEGIYYSVDLRREPGQRIHISELRNGRTFHPDSIYKVVTNSYIASKFEDPDVLGWQHSEIMNRLTGYNMPSIVYVLYKYFTECSTAYTPSTRTNCDILPEDWWRQTKAYELQHLNPTW